MWAIVVGVRSCVIPALALDVLREVWPSCAPESRYLSNQSVIWFTPASSTVLSSAKLLVKPKPVFHERQFSSLCSPLRTESPVFGLALYCTVQSTLAASLMREAVLTASTASGEAAVTTSTGTQRRWVMRSPCLAMTSACGCSTLSHSDPGWPGFTLKGMPAAEGAARDWKPVPVWSKCVYRRLTCSM